MSAAYTLHVAPDFAPGDPRALERADLVRDGFSWGAFLVPSLWFLRHRHWLLALGVAAAVVGLASGLRALGAGLGTILMAEVLLHGLFGLEGPTLRRWALARRGRPAVDVVYAASEAEAETKSFGRWLDDPAPVARAVPPVVSALRANPFARPGHEPVIGLFPDLEGRR
ncbi:DUF2628 domain-containing protein [Enterovirga sp.]|uniref:DUF2628 domain-containing protein n=1 Tax=Enterovirga sp. TaxID=2026350 RepID=UPI00262E6C44|nr:DUF2628 domain-containing protein [Enterovirga sp.]MDB5589685.1 hypothetical protein [Enterovirga sp.]